MALMWNSKTAAALLIAVASFYANSAFAETCAGTAVAARGEPASFEWLAKTKARANWRSRVRATSKLGATYSNWSRAQGRDERCERGPQGVVCTFAATPCRL